MKENRFRIILISVISVFFTLILLCSISYSQELTINTDKREYSCLGWEPVKFTITNYLNKEVIIRTIGIEIFTIRQQKWVNYQHGEITITDSPSNFTQEFILPPSETIRISWITKPQLDVGGNTVHEVACGEEYNYRMKIIVQDDSVEKDFYSEEFRIFDK